MKKRHKPIRTPVMRGEANYYLSKLYHLGDDAKKLGQLLWRHGFRAGILAARKQFNEEVEGKISTLSVKEDPGILRRGNP